MDLDRDDHQPSFLLKIRAVLQQRKNHGLCLSGLYVSVLLYVDVWIFLRFFDKSKIHTDQDFAQGLHYFR